MTIRLEIVGGACRGQRESFPEPPVRVGRRPGSDLQLHPERDLEVSGEHALIDRDAGGWFVRDLDSRNGTLVNGERLRADRYLEDGDEIELGTGGPRLRVRIDEEVPPTEDPPETLPGMAPVERGGDAGKEWAKGPLAAAVVLGLAALGVVLWTNRGDAPDGETAGPEPGPALRSDSGRVGSPPPGLPAGDPVDLDSLRQRMDSLRGALARSRERVRRLEEELASGDARQGAQKSRERLEQELQSASAALRRLQLASEVDFARVRSRNWRALAQLYVERADGRVVTATGFAVDTGGTLLTSRHVVAGPGEGPRRIAVQFARSEQVWPARMLAMGDAADLALLQVEKLEGRTPAIHGLNHRPDTLPPGSPVVIMGFPLGGEVSSEGDPAGSPPRPLLTVGLLSGRADGLLEFRGYGDRGGSGSPIFDEDGRVVAILMGGRDDGDGRILLGVPAPAALALLRGSRSPPP